MKIHLRFLHKIMIPAFVVLTMTACQTAPAWTQQSNANRSLSSKEKIDPAKYEKALRERIDRIPEFRAIREWARSRGLHVWLGGGSATGIAAYLREEMNYSGDDLKARFPYNYYDIYRSTQDADIVLDGDEKAAAELENFLRTELGHLQGSKSIWEVRLLRQPRGQGVGKKDPIIGSTDFRNQNSDSYSTALVEITEPKRGENRVRDAFDWNNHGETTFFRDLLDAKLTYYRNPLHSGTSRAVAGWNPEIISVIRAFSKAHQYDADIRDESFQTLKKVVAEFDPDAHLDSQAVRYILGNATKIFQHSRDIEATWNALEASGLRTKLIRFANRHGNHELVTLMSREPLRSYELGKTPKMNHSFDGGQTARQLGLADEIFSHETGTFLAYENITMSREGKPNFFMSRNGVSGEAAVHGDGLYGRQGRIGGRGTGITIRFQLNPDAVAGRDFYKAAGDYYVFLNANAIRVLPEDRLSLSIGEFMALLDQGNFSVNDRGVLQKMKLKMMSNALLLTDEEVDNFYRGVRAQLVDTIRNSDNRNLPASLELFMSIAKSEVRLKELFAFDIAGDSNINPMKRLEILERYGIIDGVFSEKMIKHSLWEAVKIQSAGVLRFPLNPDKVLLWHKAYLEAVKADAVGAQKILTMAVETADIAKLALAKKQLAVVGMGNLIDEKVIRLLKENKAGSHTTQLFETFNEYAMRLPTVPTDLRELALRADNPISDLWGVLLEKNTKTPQQILDAMINLEKVAAASKKQLISNWWAMIVGYYDKAYASSPETSVESMRRLLQRHRGTGRFEEIALDLLNRPELTEYVGKQTIAKLATAPVFFEKSTITAKYYTVLNAYLAKKDEVPRAYRKWALNPKNPMRARWLDEEKFPDATRMARLRRIRDRYDGKMSSQIWISQWKSAYADAALESPARARAISLDILQQMRGPAFSEFSKELILAGMGDDVAALAIAKLETLEVFRLLGTPGMDKASKKFYYEALNFQIATLSSLPKNYAKYALAKDNPSAEQWKALPKISASSLCLRLLKRVF